MSLPDVIIRTHRPGDMGLIIHQHGVLYSNEYGFDDRFEALVARITADFLENFDSAMERCWIAERVDKFLGSIMLVKDKEHENAAKLRLLAVSAESRGLGLGSTLVQEAIRFAKEAGYTSIVLWTQSSLVGARKIYAKAGFQLMDTTEQELWGHEVTSENWKLELSK
ncbi:acyl-CoA N-acyltransferase [Stachybotrys elegans]|uniref:Acyl-CoA N-acyltransferase n=1 Tax=Stachybotrys elegans TaxID=80388 RepID=A0A8K0T3V1_9HYPO|nr:acyl-CoA N-acyltransferase [Stachybotrys elegans]